MSNMISSCHQQSLGLLNSYINIQHDFQLPSAITGVIKQLHKYPTWFPYQMMLASFNRNSTSVSSGSGITYPPEHMCSPWFYWGLGNVSKSLDICAVFCGSLCFILSIFAQPLHCYVFLQFTPSDYTTWYHQSFLAQIY